jgi:hypothetical protein
MKPDELENKIKQLTEEVDKKIQRIRHSKSYTIAEENRLLQEYTEQKMILTSSRKRKARKKTKHLKRSRSLEKELQEEQYKKIEKGREDD